tara:strand:- start:292 stop:489 length:198 start_codon:yes stop_codon:yes gene_type:complete
LNCASCNNVLVLEKDESCKVTYQIPEEFELIQGAEFAYLCNGCYNNGTPEKPDLWKSSQKEIELI